LDQAGFDTNAEDLPTVRRRSILRIDERVEQSVVEQSVRVMTPTLSAKHVIPVGLLGAVIALAAFGKPILGAYSGIDSRIVYNPPAVVTGTEDSRCSTGPPHSYIACRLAVMKRDGATPAAIRFARALTAFRGYFGYAEGVRLGRFGPVALVRTLPSGVSTYGSGYLVSLKRFVDPDVVTPGDRSSALRNQTFRALLRSYPRAEIWSQSGGVFEIRRRTGGQRFLVHHPIVDGCHACSLLGAADIALDFDAKGNLQRRTLVRVQLGKKAWFGY
jgi:hypothetical protein